jgi:N-acyl-D-amino-acid deacylase
MKPVSSRIFVLFLIVLGACTSKYDVVIRGGTIYDGSGSPGYVGDIAIEADTIVAVGEIAGRGRTEIDATGMAVSPGFINMLSWAVESLIEDGRSRGDIRQGVTLEVFGEGSSWAPLNDAMKQSMVDDQDGVFYEIEWTTLSEYLEYLVGRGVSPNVASFVGATTVRVHEIGRDDRPPTPEELERMKALVREAMEGGAMGLGSSLIYAPAFFASTEELVELARIVAEYDGRYITHMRSEGNGLIQAVEEVLRISREAEVGAEIYHLKAAGQPNWGKLDEVIGLVEGARTDGLDVSANMYLYTAGATGLDASMPPWVQAGGYDSWAERLGDAAIRARVISEMTTPTDEWENLYLAAGSAEKLLLVGFRNDSLKYLTGKTLAEVAGMRGTSPEETAIDLVIQNGADVSTVYFLMSDENVRRQIALPWVSFGSDGQSMAPEGVFVESSTHPRAYGNFARLLGKYVRDESVIPLEEAVRKLTSLPATNLKIRGRGTLAPGFYADIVVFDPETIADHATFDNPHQLATGVRDVLVNGELVLRDEMHTGALPGRVVRGPGWTGWDDQR